MIKKIALILLFVCFCFGEENIDLVDKKDKAEVKKIEQNIIKEKEEEALKIEEEKRVQEIVQQKAKELDMQNIAQINILLEKIAKIELELKDNILLKRYSNYLSYSKISMELEILRDGLKKKSNVNDEQVYQLHSKIKIKENELELIGEYKGSPIGGLINPPEIEKYENITNPFGIINSLSHIKKLENNKKQFKSLDKEIDSLTTKLEDELVVYLELFNLDPKPEYKDKITFLDKQKKDFSMVLDIVSTTEEVYTRKIEQVILEIENQISQQGQKLLGAAVSAPRPKRRWRWRKPLCDNGYLACLLR